MRREDSITYWQKQLATAQLDLPTDTLRSQVRMHHSSYLPLRLPPDMMPKITSAFRQVEVPLSSYLMTTLSILFARYSEQDDFLLGIELLPVTQTALPLRISYHKRRSFRDFLQEVHSVIEEASRAFPSASLLHELAGEGSTVELPIFQTIVSIREEPDLAGDNSVAGPQDGSRSHQQLHIYVEIRRENVLGWVEYNGSLFKEETITRLIRHFYYLLEQVTTRPDDAVGEYTILLPEEYTQSIEHWNKTGNADFERYSPLSLLASSAHYAPDRLAVVFDDMALTYAELHKRSNQFAHYLQRCGVGPEVQVGIYVERSLDMLLCVLGVLKAGGAYVPLDPAYPQDRLNFMVSDAGLTLLLAHRYLPEYFSATSAQILFLDTLHQYALDEPGSPPEVLIHPQQACYLIYTSGSTGRPKGTILHHRGLSNLVCAQVEAFHLHATDHVLQFSSFSFDASVWEMVMSLDVGATLYLAQQEKLLPGPDLIRFLQEHAISVITCTSSVLAVLPEASFPALQTVITAGEACNAEVAARWSLHCAFFNAYGPTESTVCATIAVYDYNAFSPPPIGKPITNTQVYVLDGQMQPVPIGVAGELYLGGEGLARGYLHRSDLTAERFVPHPFSTLPSARLYRSGDRARWRADGSLEFLGRLDQQIKVRGFRIELGEIEATIQQHPQVLEAVALLRPADEQQTEPLLLSYVVPGAGQTLAEAELRSYLQERLPHYMLPARLLVLERFPLTATGKIDRLALARRPLPALGQLDTLHEAPQGPVEELLAQVWMELLHLPAVGRHDNFFALGGHSLLGTQIIARLHARLPVSLRLQDLFAAPTIAQFAQVLHLAQQQTLALPPLVAGARPDPLPLSFAQERLWFLEQWQPDSTTYLIPWVLHLEGPLELSICQQSVQALVERHESLRTCFPAVLGLPQQRIAATLSCWLPLISLEALYPAAVEEQQALVFHVLQQHLLRPFDLTQAPLWRGCVLRVRPQEHLLLFVFHHIILDGWSLEVMEEELRALYQALLERQPHPLAPLPLQPADVALWQRSWLEEQGLSPLRTFWLDYLRDAPLVLDLPADRPRPPVQRFRGAHAPFTIPAAVRTGLLLRCQQEQVTLFVGLLSIFAVLLERISGHKDLLIGTPVAQRSDAAVEKLVGFFVNTLVIRLRLSPYMTFAELFAQAREQTLSAYAHQDFPFEQLVSELETERDLSRSAVIQTMLVLQHVAAEPPAWPHLQVARWQVPAENSKFDLTLFFQDSGRELRGFFEYDKDLFTEERIERMTGWLQQLLEQVAEQVNHPLHTYTLLSASERKRLLQQWQPALQPLSDALTLPLLVEHQVERTPDAIALAGEGHLLTYAALNRYANQLAQQLHQHGVGPEVRVALCLPRSPSLLIALLAILKAGGAYVPLDPEYPAQRLGFLIRDSQAQLLLTTTELIERIPTQETPVLLLKDDWQDAGASESRNPVTQLTPQNLAYIIYTSGSTGQAKGVGITHRSASTLIAWAHLTYSPEDLSATLASTSICFDLSVFELFAPLTCGGKVVLVQHLPNSAPLQRQQGVTLINTVPSVLQAFLAEQPFLTGVRIINLAGEPLSSQLVERLYQIETVERVYNLYGPSEDTTYSTYCQVANNTSLSISIGRPITNTQVYVLDGQMQPVPIGVAGELYLGGEGLARGYLHRPDLTAERFVPHPFSTLPSARLYRSGDRARWRADGSLEFLGRLDQQIKVRGFRIELGEIEATIQQHPQVLEAVALLRPADEQQTEPLLLSYVVPGAGQTLAEAELRSYLQERLPHYMLPARLLVLERFPLTSTGKIDRLALTRRPLPALAQLDTLHEAPQGPVEELLAQVWMELLHLPAVGRHDNFFALGGHSLLATQIIARLHARLPVSLRLQDLFAAPTIAQFAQVLHLAQQQTLALPPLMAGARPDPLPLSFAQERLWFLEQWQPDSTTYLIPWVLHLEGPLQLSICQQSVQALVERHESLRTCFPAVLGLPQQRIAATLSCWLPLISLEALYPAAVEEQQALVFHVLQQHLLRPFDLTQAPLWRGCVLRVRPQEHLLLFVFHHIILDGWSLEVMEEELRALYQALLERQPHPLAPLPLQPADVALWQRSWLQEQGLSPLRTFWLDYLRDAPLVLDLPADRPRPPVQRFRGAHAPFTIPAAVRTGLLLRCQQEQVTLFVGLLSVFAVLLERISGQEDLLIGTPVAQRSDAAVEKLVGFFVNTLVIRLRLSPHMTFAELFAQAREQTLSAYAHQDFPFEQLVSELETERDLSRSAVIQTMLVLQYVAAEPPAWPHLQVARWQVPAENSKFDLTLFFQDSGRELSGVIKYNAELFTRERIERMTGWLQQILEQVTGQVNHPLHTYTLLSASEREQLLQQWQPALQPLPEALTLPLLVEHQVERTPDAIALAAEDHLLTYSALNRYANQLAQQLHQHGVGPEVRVALCLPRSPSLLIALLAILKAGGAYVPLDPEYPAQRLGFLIRDSQAQLLLTTTELIERIPTQETPVLLLKDDWQDAGASESRNPVTQLAPQNLAYILYTSGSTGQPKGVMISHRSICNRLLWQPSEKRLTSTDKIIHKTSLNFDVSVWEIFWPLVSGGSVIIAEPGGQRDIAYLSQLITTQQATALHFVPSMLRHFLGEADLAQNTSLRHVFCGGEALTHDLLELFFAHPHLHATLYNFYGPTEATIEATSAVCTLENEQTIVPIGRPIANMQVYVLDGQMQPVPIGVAGELYLGGEGLARGYLHRPDLTAERFVPHPFSTLPSARLYRSGDRARWRDDGSLEFLGRLDQQIKVRGFRIELGEIEATIQEHPQVLEAVALLRPADEQQTEPLLLSYVVPGAGQTLTEAELRSYLQERLPHYMLPSRLLVLERFPLTATGKIDRLALARRPLPALTQLDTLHEAPQGPVEELLAQVWMELLHLPEVGRHENFFALGGHSLLSTQICARLRDALRITIPLSMIFAYPTVAELAEALQKIQQQEKQASEQTPVGVLQPQARSREAYRVKRSASGSKGQA
ncbi:non-ribosomal peptide synthetase [Tengunoibacter tsumagoiensis]|uniref:Carrier domain-containing protein n=1 Tax=Tengunoibacter tsumagoiensis TaxID=2014871 RepID=A0A402A993_9CHLR|nr:non-ribosomal peptide synthetase [Tengunoibacter tsumagoiensis]GCE15699.1 hypothetical protein KTT_55580 [Tengunoibacter tsumagoiensis]